MSTTLPPLDFTTKTPPKESKSQKTDTVAVKPSRIGSPLTALLLLVVAILGVSIPLYLVTSSNRKAEQKAENPTLSIETQNSEIKAALLKEFVYTASGPTNYYSPTLDTSFKVDTSVMLVSEGGMNIGISPRKDDGIYADMQIMTEDPIAYYKTFYAIYDKATITEVSQKDDYRTFSVSYQKQNLLKKTELLTVTAHVFVRQDTTTKKYFVLKVTAYAPAKLSEALTAQYVEIIKTAVLAPTDIAPTVSASLADSGLKVSFDKKLWTVNSQGTNYLSLNYVTAQYTDPYVSIRFNTRPLYLTEKSNTVLDSMIADEIKYTKEYNKDFVLISDKLTRTFAGQELRGTSFTYAGITGKAYITKYFGFVPNADQTIDITVTKFIDPKSKAPQTYADTEINKILDSGAVFEAITAAETSDSVLGENSFTIEKPALIGKLGTVHIANTLCSELQIDDPQVLPSLSGRKLPLCYSGTGSGFFVNSNGTIVSNAHVAANNPFSGTADLFMAESSPIFQAVYSNLYAPYLAATGKSFMSETERSDYASVVRVYILQLIGQKKITFTNTTYQNYLETTTPFEFDATTGKLKNPALYTKLTVIKANTLTSQLEHLGRLVIEKKSLEDNPYTLTVPDLAILKVDVATTTYPTLNLASTAKLLEGTNLLTIGFPGLADNRSLFSDASSMSAIIAKGTISAIKPNAGNLFNLIQTDAAINHGNSGGPMVNDDADVVGVSTYLLSDDGGSYGAGVSVEEVGKMLTAEGITAEKGTVTTTLLTAIDNMQKEYYTWALRDLDTVLSEYPQSKSIVGPLKLLVQEKIDAGEDNTPVYVIGTTYIHKGDIPYILGGLGIALVVLLLSIVMLLKKSKKKSSTTSADPVAPVQPPAVQPEPEIAQEPAPSLDSAVQQAMTQVTELNAIPVVEQPAPIATPEPAMQPEIAQSMPPQTELPPLPPIQDTEPEPPVPVYSEPNTQEVPVATAIPVTPTPSFVSTPLMTDTQLTADTTVAAQPAPQTQPLPEMPVTATEQQPTQLTPPRA